MAAVHTTTQNDEKLTTLRQKWEEKAKAADAILDDPKSSGELLTKAEKLYNERDEIGKEIEARQAELERANALRGRKAAGEKWLNSPAAGPPPGAGSFSYKGAEAAGHVTFGRDADGRASVLDEAGPGTFGAKRWELLNSFEYKLAFAQYLRKGARQIDLSTKTLMEAIDDQGGVFAPAELINRIIGREPAPTQLRGLVQNLTTGRDTLIMPRKQYSADDKYTTAFRPTKTGEIPSDGTGAMHGVDDTKLLGNVEIPVHTFMLSAPVTKNLVEDSAFPIQAWLESELNQVIDLLYEDMILNGSGIGEPTGILFGANVANDGTDPLKPEVIKSGSAGSITVDSLDDLQTALPPQYESANTAWVTNKKSGYRAIRKLRDDQKRPLFSAGTGDQGIASARGRVLYGDPIVLSAFMPNVSAGSFPLIYGDLRGFYLVNRIGFSIQVLDQTRAKANQIELVGRVRFGGKTVEPFRLKILAAAA